MGSRPVVPAIVLPAWLRTRAKIFNQSRFLIQKISQSSFLLVSSVFLICFLGGRPEPNADTHSRLHRVISITVVVTVVLVMMHVVMMVMMVGMRFRGT